MCGITGFFSPSNPINTARYYAAHSLVRHRGPDDEGFVATVNGVLTSFRGDDTISFFHALSHIETVNNSTLVLGHRRLSIIDLTYQGHQPFFDPERNFCIVYNGEIFNYIELRDELKAQGVVFQTHADTEVVLHAFISWGTAAFNKFNGMWAAAIYDVRRAKLVLTRDRFGIKPLFYSIHKGTLSFGSEMKFLHAFAGRTFAVNESSVRNYLDRNLLNHSDATFWSGISELEPGHFLEFSGSGTHIQQYWTYRPAATVLSVDDAVDKFTHLFEDSLKLRMRSDVEVGTLLSGGLDSTTIVCALNKLGYVGDHNFKTFSAVFADERFTEKPYIDKTTADVSVQPYFVCPRPEDVDADLMRLLYHIEEPFRSLSVYSQFLIYHMIKRETGVKVVLNGQGADELFGGYRPHYFYFFAELAKKARIAQLTREMLLYRKYRGDKTLSLLKGTIRQWLAALGTPNFFNVMTFRELSFSALREYLKYDDRNSMAFGIEARVPFLDYRLVQFAYSLDARFKINGFVNKRIVREYARAMVPAPILERKDKMGFVSPQEFWQKNELAKLFADEFAGIKAHGLFDFLDVGKLVSTYNAYRDGSNNDWGYIWRIFCLSRWKKVWDQS